MKCSVSFAKGEGVGGDDERGGRSIQVMHHRQLELTSQTKFSRLFSHKNTAVPFEGPPKLKPNQETRMTSSACLTAA